MNTPEKIGAFFDLDGTLLGPPSLEWRFIVYLLERDEITTAKVARWIATSTKAFLSQGWHAVLANKSYLVGIHESVVEDWGDTAVPRSLLLFTKGIDCMCWHLERGHRVELVTGTLAPLARAMAHHLPNGVNVQATELATKGGRFTGKLFGAHLSFDEKERSIRQAAAAFDVALAHSFAYGNEMSDVAMLKTVGHPVAVNPSSRLKREAQKRGWAVHNWSDSGEEKKQAANTALAPEEAR
jgi:putative phosphoserine phosphatase / 1-acylglycerol-3-phosphate O-acyltransferase